MSIRYIVFNDRAVEAEGLVALARKTRVDALPGSVYRVGEKDFAILRNLGLGFRIVSDEEARLVIEEIGDNPSPER